MKSTITLIPIEIVIPPASVSGESHAGGAIILTYLVIVAGTVGSVFGASLMNWIVMLIGRPLVLRHGKYLFVTEAKLKHAVEQVVKYRAMGIFQAHILPGVRHLNPIPVGIVMMRFQIFAMMTPLAGTSRTMHHLNCSDFLTMTFHRMHATPLATPDYTLCAWERIFPSCNC